MNEHQQWPPVDGIWAEPKLGRGDWDQPGQRRQGLRQLHQLHRYGLMLRAPNVRPLTSTPTKDLSGDGAIDALLNSPPFVGLVGLQEDQIFVEQYAEDFDANQVHSIQSISKTLVSIIAGQCVTSDSLDLSAKVATYIPEIGSGYAHATVQQLLDMNVVNAYSEDYADPNATVGRLECAHGWRVGPVDDKESLRHFLIGIGGEGSLGTDKAIQYKTANTDLAAWVCERASGKPLLEYLLELIEQAGVSQPVYISTDRQGVPFLGGGLHMTLPDLARLGRLYCFADTTPHPAQCLLQQTLNDPELGTHYPDGTCYRNCFESDGTFLGHQGYGGQYLYVEPHNRVVIAVFSALESVNGFDYNYIIKAREACRSLAQHII